MLLTGALADRFGSRATAAAFAGFAVAVCLPALTRTVGALAASLLLLGALSGAVDVTINGAVASLERERRRSLMNQAHALFPVGALAGSGAAALARGAGVGAEPILAAVAPRARRGRRFVASHMLLALGVVCALGFMIENGLESWSAVQLADTLGAGPGVAGLGPAAFAAAMVAGRLLMHRLDNPRLLSGAALLCAAGLALFAAADSVWLALTGVVIAGLGVSGVAPTILGIGGRVAAEGEQSASIATVTTVSYLGFLIGPVLVGGVAGATSLRVG